MKLCEFSLNQKWTLLYRGSEDGFGSFDFHSECDGQSKTLTIIRAEGTSYIFGGFTNAINEIIILVVSGGKMQMLLYLVLSIKKVSQSR